MPDPEAAIPFAENQGAKIYREEAGRGARVLLFMRPRWASCFWRRTEPFAAKYCRSPLSIIADQLLVSAC